MVNIKLYVPGVGPTKFAEAATEDLAKEYIAGYRKQEYVELGVGSDWWMIPGSLAVFVIEQT